MSESQDEIISQLMVPRYATRLKPTSIPAAAWNDEPLLCLKVNDEWASHILGVLIALDQPDTWIGTADEIFAARQQVNEIMLALMEDNCDPMSNCCPEPLTRILPDGTLEVSYDGGLTWQPATTEDPRNLAPQLPPITGDDGAGKRCNAANSVVVQFKDGIAAFTNAFDVGSTLIAFATACAATIIAIILAPPVGIAIVVGILLPLFGGIWSLGKDLYVAAFDDSIYNDLLCILYCHCQPDGTYSDAGFDAILADIQSKFTASTSGIFIARDAFTAITKGAGLPGLNNMARIGGGGLDCDDCECACPTIWLNHQGLPSTVLLPDEGTDCQFTVASQVNTSGVSYLYFLTDADPSVLTPGFRVLTATSADTITTIGYKNLDGSVVTGHLPDPSGKVAWLFYEDEAPFTVVLTSGP